MMTSAAERPRVGVVMGSQSDWETMRHAVETLTKLGESKEGVPGKPMFRTISMVFSPDGKLLAVTSNAPTFQVQLWNAATGRLVRQFGKAGGAAKLAFSPDSKLLAVGGDLDIKL